MTTQQKKSLLPDDLVDNKGLLRPHQLLLLPCMACFQQVIRRSNLSQAELLRVQSDPRQKDLVSLLNWERETLKSPLICSNGRRR